MRAGPLDRVIRAHARRIGARQALVCCGRSGVRGATWADLDAATARLAAHLDEIVPEHAPACLVVSLEGRDLREVLTLIACLRLAAPVLVVNGRQAAPMRQALIDEVARRGYPLVVATAERPELTEPGGGPSAPPRLEPDCVLLASGGSTGRPTIVIDRRIRTAPGRPAAVRPFLRTGWRPGQRQLVCSPLYHAAGLAPFVEGLAGGNTSYVLPVFDARLAGDVVDRASIGWLQMTPFHMSAVLARSRGPAAWGGSPRLVHMADHCPGRVKRAFHEALGPESVHEMYTASEGIGMTMARGEEWDERPGTVGRGFFTALRVADEEGRPLAPHATGEVYLRSGARTTATYAGAAGRLRVTPDGFATLGDVGHLDEDGYLYLRPRQLVTIAVGGTTVSATEVEAELMEHPGITDVGVCAQASADLGERVVAVVVPAERGLTQSAVRRWARARLASAQVPVRCVFTSALPRADTGKLDRAALFALVNDEAARKAESECGSS